jgi:hypothetical protein
VTDSALATVNDTAAGIAEQVVIKGDLSKLTDQQRMTYYTEVCRSLGLNPLTRPFDYIVLNGKMVLYANRGCADQLRAVRAITITSLDPRQIGDLFVVVATGRDRTGREDSSTGAVATAGLRGEALANAMMKAETKAKRRLTLSLAGLGWSDETEVDSIPGAVRPDVDPETGEIRKPPSLAERAAERRASLTPASPQEPATAAEEAAFRDADATEAPAAAPGASEPVRCNAPSPWGEDSEPCAKAASHTGNHQNHARESWEAAS